MTGNIARDFIQSISTKWQDYRSARALRAELEQADPATVSILAAELGVTPHELKEMAAGGSSAESLMLRMAQAYGIDPQELRRKAPWAMRDLGFTCAHCGDKRRCTRELEAGTAREHADQFCPNAGQFPDLAEMVARNA